MFEFYHWKSLLLYLVLIIVMITPRIIYGKVFSRCELGSIFLQEGIEYGKLGDWLCLANATSNYNSSMIGGFYTNPWHNFQYGIFQISNYYHCYDEWKQKNNDCGLNCTELLDDNLSDDIRCARLIYYRAGRQFTPWNQFDANCNSSDGNQRFYTDCDFANGIQPRIITLETNITLFRDQLTPGQHLVDCIVYGTLPIEIKWLKNHKTLDSLDPDLITGKVEVDDKKNLTTSSLLLRHTNLTLNEYITLCVCEAVNKYGKDSKDFLIKFAEQLPDIIEPPDLLRLKVIELAATIVATATVIIIFSVIIYKFFIKKQLGLDRTEIVAFLDGDKEKILVVGSTEQTYLPESLLSQPYDSDFEIVRQDVRFDSSTFLDSGQFGLVYKGRYKDEIDVAVKTLKPTADKLSLMALLSELKILIHVKGHPNVIGIIGAYTKELSRSHILVLLEFCPYGSLFKYLQSYRENLKPKKDALSPLQKDLTTKLEVTNKPVPPTEITQQNMLAWSYQIASAMEYLGSKKVVHGDLATRNILLLNPSTIKITDFGLSRKLHQYSVYIRGDYKELLPWKWLAPETLRDLKFSTASDVWSFGVTLWEIFSFAEQPYPGLSWTLDFWKILDNGLRLTKPQEATISIYRIFEECWKMDPLERPTFALLRQNIFLEINRFSKVEYIVLEEPNLATTAHDMAYRRSDFL